MIRRIVVSNFKSLGKDVRVELGPLTALVGANGAGKSNFADVLRFVADCMHLGAEAAITKRHGISAVRRWSGGRPYNVEIAVDVESDEFRGHYEFGLAGNKSEEYRVAYERADVVLRNERHEFELDTSGWKGPSGLHPKVDALSLALPLVAGDERFAPLADALRRMEVYSIFPDALRQPQRYDPTKPMEQHGANWVSILKDQEDRPWHNELIAVLNKLTGDIDDVRVRPVGGYLTVEFTHRNAEPNKRSKVFDASQQSDGTLRVAGMITALLQEPRPMLVGLEEPELTVHPGALRVLNDFVQEAASSGQVLLTTHSPDLLDLLRDDEVRVVARREGVTTIEPLDEGQRKVVRDGLFSLGEVLRSEGLKQSEQLPLDLDESAT